MAARGAAGLPDGIFSNQKSKLCNFWRVLQWKMLVYYMEIWSTYFTAIWYTFWTFGLFYSRLVYFRDIRYISWYFGIFCPRFGMLYQEKSGNPEEQQRGQLCKYLHEASALNSQFSNYVQKSSGDNAFISQL
jgi:hypothetical protein